MTRPEADPAKVTRKRAPRALFVLFDGAGELCGTHETQSGAEADAWGPRFRGFTVREYRLVVRKRKVKR